VVFYNQFWSAAVTVPTPYDFCQTDIHILSNRISAQDLPLQHSIVLLEQTRSAGPSRLRQESQWLRLWPRLMALEVSLHTAHILTFKGRWRQGYAGLETTTKSSGYSNQHETIYMYVKDFKTLASDTICCTVCMYGAIKLYQRKLSESGLVQSPYADQRLQLMQARMAHDQV